MANTYTRRINLYINDKEVKNNIQSIQKEFYKANNELKGMEVGSKEYTTQMAKVKSLKGILADHNKQLSTTQTKTQKLIGAAKGMLPAMGWAAVAAGAVKAAKKVAQFVDETFKMRQQVQKLTGLTGKDLANMTAGLKSSADTFKQDFEQLAIANNAFAQSMGISQQEANKLINDGFLAGADASGEFLAQLKEYGPQLYAAGISAEQAIVLMSQSATEGLFSDKGIDSIKEATLRLREMPKATQEALEGIGISSSQMMSQLASGEITVYEAIQQVSRKLGELPPQSSQVGTAIADIFGGAGEDAGLEFIKMLGTAETSMEQLKKRTGETGETQQMLLEANQKLNQAWSDLVGTGSGGFDRLKAKSKLFMAEGLTQLVIGIQKLRNWFIDFYNKSAPLRAWLAYVGLVFKTQMNVAKTALKSFWEGLKSVGNIIKAVFTGQFKEIPAIIKDGFSTIGDEVKAGVDKGKEHFDEFVDKIKNGRIELPPIEQEINVKTNKPTGGSLVKEFEKNRIMTNKAVTEIKEEFTLELEDDGVFDEESAQKGIDALNRYEELKQKFKSEEETQAEQFNNELAELQEAMDSGLLTHEQYEKKKLEITNQYSSKRLDAENKYLKGAGAVVDTFASVFEAAKQRELAAAGDNAAQREAIEKKYAKKQQKIAIGQAFINGAKAQLKILAEVPKGDFGIMTAILMAAAAAATAAEIATIKNQQFKSGGFTSLNTSDSKPAGIVHANEWVASAPLLRNPETRRHIDYLENVQRGIYPRFDTSNITGALSRGFAVGGYTTPPAPVVSPNTNINEDILIELMQTMKENTLASRELANKNIEVNALEIRDKIDKFNKAINANTL